MSAAYLDDNNTEYDNVNISELKKGKKPEEKKTGSQRRREEEEV
jgi:hypothetical protein